MKAIRRCLPFLLILTLLAGGLVSCGGKRGNESYDPAAYAALRDYVRDKKGVGRGLTILAENDDMQVYFYLQAPKTEEEKDAIDKEPLYLSMIKRADDERYNYGVDLVLDPDDFHSMLWRWRYADTKLGEFRIEVEAQLDPATYTGDAPMPFDSMVFHEPSVTETEAATADTESASETAVETTASSDGAATEASTIVGEEAEEYLSQLAAEMTNFALRSMDEFTQRALGHSLEDFGFKALAEEHRYDPDAVTTEAASATATADLGDLWNPALMTLSNAPIIPLSAVDTEAADTTDTTVDTTDTVAETEATTTAPDTEAVTEAETAEDLGSAFSPARLSYAGRMTLLGMGMVFAVLALQWLILVIFRRLLASKTDKPAKEKKAVEEAPAPAPAPVTPAAPVGDDPAVIAAITAAIAAMIESDSDLSSEFAGGFRVVSFKKKSGKTSWNH